MKDTDAPDVRMPLTHAAIPGSLPGWRNASARPGPNFAMATTYGLGVFNDNFFKHGHAAGGGRRADPPAGLLAG